MEKRWHILEGDPAKVSALQTALKIHPILCELLVQRGIEDFDKAKQFFRPSLNDLHDPWAFHRFFQTFSLRGALIHLIKRSLSFVQI